MSNFSISMHKFKTVNLFRPNSIFGIDYFIDPRHIKCPRFRPATRKDQIDQFDLVRSVVWSDLGLVIGHDSLCSHDVFDLPAFKAGFRPFRLWTGLEGPE